MRGADPVARPDEAGAHGDGLREAVRGTSRLRFVLTPSQKLERNFEITSNF